MVYAFTIYVSTTVAITWLGTITPGGLVVVVDFGGAKVEVGLWGRTVVLVFEDVFRVLEEDEAVTVDFRDEVELGDCARLVAELEDWASMRLGPGLRKMRDALAIFTMGTVGDDLRRGKNTLNEREVKEHKVKE